MPKMSPDIHKCPCGGKFSSVENHCLKSSKRIRSRKEAGCAHDQEKWQLFSRPVLPVLLTSDDEFLKDD
jgi:hypothetical protein